jgi:hypothetical protein
MKNLRYAFLILAVLLAATAVRAQETKVRANIPFDFIVGDRAYPAGQYSLNSLPGNDAVIRIDGDPEVPTVHLLSNSCQSANPSKETKLIFRRMGENYFLYQVWLAGNIDGREFLKSRTEVLLAKNHEKPETVIVAANISK